ncbi:ribosomal protein L37AE/L43A [Stenotrophomonas rhizophila]
MTDQTNNAITDEDLDTEWCPECGGDDVIDLADGNQFCRECRVVIDY